MTPEPEPRDGKTLAEIEARIDEKFRDTYEESVLSKPRLDLLIYTIAVLFFGYHLWYGYTFQIPRSNHAIIHLGFVLVLWGLFNLLEVDRSTTRGKLLSVGLVAYTFAALVPIGYMHRNYDAIVLRAGAYTDTDIMVGAVLIVLVLIALASISRLITGIALFGLVYSYFGQWMPGILSHRGLSTERIITMNTVEMQGLIGTLLEISATWVVIFLMLAGIMEKYGGMATFIKGMTRLAARAKRVEIGQVAVAASMFMGSINGSTAANTATTGAFTIPLMKENGYKPKVAAAIEAVASCGGQVLPPIMGAGAFIMAELISPSYSEIIVGATAPAVLFFFTVSIAISLNSQKTMSATITAEVDQRSPARRLFDVLRHYEYLVMFTVLLYYLVVVAADPMVAGFYSILVLVGLRLVRAASDVVTRQAEPRQALELYSRQTLEGMRRAAEVTIDITILLASLGIVIRALIVTGFAQSLSSYLVVLGGGVLIVMLLLAMVASIAFGMGMSTTAAYLIVAILVAPALVDIGVQDFTAHMFVFYFAIVSNITPPIALSVIIGMGIAGSSFWETALESFKIGFPMFLLPFAFFYNEALLYPGTETVVAFAIVLAGFIAISVGLIGHVREGVPLVLRPVFVVLGLGAIFAPVLVVQIVLAAVVALGVGYLYRTGTVQIPTPQFS